MNFVQIKCRVILCMWVCRTPNVFNWGWGYLVFELLIYLLYSLWKNKKQTAKINNSKTVVIFRRINGILENKISLLILIISSSPELKFAVCRCCRHRRCRRKLFAFCLLLQNHCMHAWAKFILTRHKTFFFIQMKGDALFQGGGGG